MISVPRSQPQRLLRNRFREASRRIPLLLALHKIGADRVDALDAGKAVGLTGFLDIARNVT